MEELIVKSSIEIAATARNVWRVLTEPELTRQYMFDCAAVTDWKPGSALEWTAIVDGKPVVHVKGVVEAIEPERFLRYTTFGVGMNLKDTPENHLAVTYRLTAAGTKTRLDITQGDFARAENGQARYEHTVGGWASVVGKMKALAEAL